MNIELLKQQHLGINGAINKLCGITDGPSEKGLLLVSSARLKLAQAVAVNTATERTYILGPLGAFNLARHVPGYTVLKADTHHLRLVFSRHVTMWTTAAIERDWLGYGRSLKGITAQLSAILDLEERSLYPAAQSRLAGVEQPG